MRYSQLRAFHNVALHGGFSRAAEALNQTQPALSEQVRRLEQDHDVLLFDREHKRVRLTGPGSALLQLTNRFFEVETQIRDQLLASRAALQGHLRLIVDSAHHITETLARFRAAQPGVFVTLRTGNTQEVLTALRHYEAEIGVVGSLKFGAELDTVPLGKTPICVITAKTGPVKLPDNPRLQDLSAMPLILRERGSRTRAQLELAAAALKITFRPAMEVEGREALREMVASGAGIGFVSQAELGHDNRIVAQPLMRRDLQMSETLVTLKQRRDVPVIGAFLALLKQA